MLQNLNSKIGANKKAEEHEARRHAERRRGKEEQTLKQWKALHAKMTRERAMKASAARSKAEAEKQAQAEAALREVAATNYLVKRYKESHWFPKIT